MADIIGAHLVGSAPVTEPEQLFALASQHLGDHLRRVPDGEVGERDTWIRWQYPRLAQCPQMEPASIDTGYLGRELQQLGLTDPHATPELVDLGYADAAIDSWERFTTAEAAGVNPEGTRFMMGLPSPLSVITMYVDPASRAVLLDAWTDAMAAQLDRILQAVPSERLAIQWEVCIEFGILEGLWTYLDTGLDGLAARDGIAAHIVQLGTLVPEPVELGYHLCYGDSGHQHFTEPSNTGHLAWAAQALFQGLERPVDWVHLPVPHDRDDDAYFAPLGDVAWPAETELYLGLVHDTGGIEGTQRRVETAARVVDRFGVATECGLGRRSLDTIADLLDQHAAVAAPHD